MMVQLLGFAALNANLRASCYVPIKRLADVGLIHLYLRRFVR